MKSEMPVKAKQNRSAKDSKAEQVIHLELTDPSAHKVCVAGTFNNWNPEAGEMDKMTGGKWAKDLMLTPGTYEYRLIVDGKWIPDPNARHAVMNPFGERNSLLTVPANGNI